MNDQESNRWERFWAIHEELDALIIQRFRVTGVFDPAQIPGSTSESALWEQLTAPEFTDILEHVVQTNQAGHKDSALIWKKALGDSRALAALAYKEEDSRIAEITHA